MSGHKPWSEISATLRVDPEHRAQIEQREQAIEAELTISQLQGADDITHKSIYRYHQELHAPQRCHRPGPRTQV